MNKIVKYFINDGLMCGLTNSCKIQNIKIGFIAIILSLLTVFSSCTPKPQTACGFVQNIYGQRISWKSKAPIKLYISNTVPEKLRPAIYRAAATWEAQAGKKVFNIIDNNLSIVSEPQKDQKNVIYFLPNWDVVTTAEQGRTSVYWSGDQIQEADIRVNAADFSFYDLNPKDLVGSFRVQNVEGHTKDGFNFEALILHEMGHLLGLKHQDFNSVMVTHLNAFSDRTQLSEADKTAVKCEYK